MRDDVAVFILTHKRPDNQRTVATLERYKYTGKVFLVIDDEDPTGPEYVKRYGDQVVVFSKSDAAKYTDDADNSGSTRGVVYARNACWGIAERLGLRYFIVLDDDYVSFSYRFMPDLTYSHQQAKQTLGDMWLSILEYFESCPQLTCVALSQGGDHIGGGGSSYNKRAIVTKRKVMNWFLCAVDRPFRFYGRINEDTTAYAVQGRRGLVFLTLMQVQLDQQPTQQQSGGLTELYLDSGTWVKSFMSLIYAPSCVRVDAMGSPQERQAAHDRIHHRMVWNLAAPMIVPESTRKPR